MIQTLPNPHIKLTIATTRSFTFDSGYQNHKLRAEQSTYQLIELLSE
jgi:hypothetical protein